MAKRAVNSSCKWLIECEPGRYRVGNMSGTIPPNMDCIIEGWHIVKNKIINKGTITFIPGNGNFHIRKNIIEN